MTDVVDSDELLRRIQRARACAHEELLAWRARSADLARAGTERAEDARDARTRGLAYEAVLRVLDEIVTPGRSTEPH
ncbi:hypothetical protein G9272_03885 [Streptomyces asoensis]|uniref:Uncharacterized protein n=1 Tax=Streptomyces asoensis TaxID=249586 RepID=A0A6M4WNV4_9ACTN|nr:hypothetical protein [Streptomyces asoensis]QJS99555.1 hypothetical protein G9272_03885 [Streptomyces asoensis]